MDDVQMSLYRAVHGKGDARPLYAEPMYFGDITHPTHVLTTLLASIAVRLGGGDDYVKAGRALWRPDQGMGGGKSHALIGAWHLGTHAEQFATTDIGKAVHAQARQILGRDLPRHLNQPKVVVLPCDSMTPGAPVKDEDGPAKTLWERFLWRLVGPDYTVYERYAPHFNNKAQIEAAIRSLGRPVLILIDEVMNYLGNASDSDTTLAGQDMEFLRALTDVINDVPHCAALIVMISTEADPMAASDTARARRGDLNTLLERNGSRAPVTENTDFAAILRRRLFETPAAAEVTSATAADWVSVLSDTAWSKSVWSTIGGSWQQNFASQVGRCYPFHPHLIHHAEEEWASVAGFQRVRSTIKIFAATVHALQKRGQAGDWVPSLIGPGDLPLSDTAVREALLDSGLIADERTVSNYRSLAENEIVTLDEQRGSARLLDLGRKVVFWQGSNPRTAERAATFLFLTSIVGVRPGGRRGASVPEIKAATAVPDLNYTNAEADGVVAVVTDDTAGGLSALEYIPGQGNNKPARYYLSTRLTYRMLVNSLRKTITDHERDQCIAESAKELISSGPFKKKIYVDADLSRTATQVLATAGIDDARTTRLVVCDAAQFHLRNGAEAETLSALSVALGLTDDPSVPKQSWASSAVFVLANTQRRALARGAATQYLARARASDAPEVKGNAELKTTATRETAEAREELRKTIKRAFCHLVYLAQPDVSREMQQHTFDGDLSTGLDGGNVWKTLASREKTFDQGDFDATALLHNLRDGDYGRPLADIRDAYWNAPRLSLLYRGEDDLRDAIYAAVMSDSLRIVNASNETVTVTDRSTINLADTGLRLARPLPSQSTSAIGDADKGSGSNGNAGGQLGTGEQPSTAQTGGGTGGGGTPDTHLKPKDKLVKAAVSVALTDDIKIDAAASLFRLLYEAADANNLTYVAGSFNIIVKSGTEQAIVEALTTLGANPTVTDQG
ncbi:AAA family ATPase [Micromonospora globispora]|uniref:AAA family ATPase n=2 Tax=Micromonospora globispora TaxID=1450148 RepID=A0A317K771_9ACTN|nr:AAA family ATPase [Micromonospora globispora]